MKPEFAISVTGLSKRYVLGSQKSGSLRESLGNWFRKKNNQSEFWALKDIQFNIEKGDVVGIIGKNGAGKSTLLKLLSQITKPSEGEIRINGRVASLLEVGTGFHPELTGRENIFLNGTILGMSRKEVKEKFDEIVAFSGVEKFIDTPVKNYSSGMYVRLAFAVAAHLEPEILIIDEVLAVGDASFQKKCLGKMSDIANQGRTVLFVSHDLGAVSSLCTKGIFLQNGKVMMEDRIENVVKAYLDDSNYSGGASKKYHDFPFLEYDGVVNLKSIRLVNVANQPIQNFFISEKVGVKINFEVTKAGFTPMPNIHVSHGMGSKLFVSIATQEKSTFCNIGSYETTVWIPENFFNNGYYNIGIAISTLDPVQVHVSDYSAISFEVLDTFDSITRNGYTGKIDGIVRPALEWEVNTQTT